jgi:hypothetical protein
MYSSRFALNVEQQSAQAGESLIFFGGLADVRMPSAGRSS